MEDRLESQPGDFGGTGLVLFAAHRPFLLFLRVAGESVWNSATTSGIFLGWWWGWWAVGRSIDRKEDSSWLGQQLTCFVFYEERLTL
jgi:hypothetical protein